MFGFSMSSFQFEMGTPGSEDPYSDWWFWCRDVENIMAGLVSGDLPEHGPGYWDLYRGDHDLAVKLGMNVIRFCTEWSRIFPKPTYNVKVDVDRDEDGGIVSVHIEEKHLRRLDEIANKNAIERYREILADWKGRGKKVILNLNHFTLPIWVHDPLKLRKDPANPHIPRGWLGDDTVIEFAKYAAYVAWRLGDLVDYWSTMNEPTAVYVNGFINVKSGFPPGILSVEYSLKAMYNLIQAHARAYDAIKYYSKKPVGIIYVFTWVDPLRGDEDKEAVEEAMYEANYMFMDAIVEGTSSLRRTGTSLSISIDRADLKGKIDWLGLNYYTRAVVTRDEKLGYKFIPGYGNLCQPRGISKAGRPVSDIGWEVYPEGLYNIVKAVYERYRLPIVISENGVADEKDCLRPRYLISHLTMLHKALREGVDVKGYLIWSLIDNYEWARGFSMRFGLAYVDYNTKKRYLRPSALVFREIAKNKEIPEESLALREI